MTEDRRHRTLPDKPSQPRPSPKAKKSNVPQPAAADTPWVAVGAIVGAFGIRGDLKIQPLTDFPERFERTATLYLGDARTPHKVESARLHKRLVVTHLSGIDTANDAERLRGVEVYIPESELAPLPEDSYYLHDLIGLRVEHVNGTPVGAIEDVVGTAGNDLFLIRTPAGAEVLLPAVKEFVKAVDLAQGVVRVAPIPGLFDDNAVVADTPGAAEDDREAEGEAEPPSR